MIQVNVIEPGAVGLRDYSQGQISLAVYPNPASQQVFVNAGGLNNGSEAGISVYNLIGQAVYTTKASVNNGVLEKEIDLGVLPQGVYVIKIQQGNKMHSGKLSVIR